MATDLIPDLDKIRTEAYAAGVADAEAKYIKLDPARPGGDMMAKLRHRLFHWFTSCVHYTEEKRVPLLWCREGKTRLMWVSYCCLCGHTWTRYSFWFEGITRLKGRHDA